MDEMNKIEEVNELRDEVNEAAETTEEAGGSSIVLKVISGALVAIVGFLTGKLIIKAYGKWKEKRAEKKQEKESEKKEETNEEIIRRALKEYAEKHPEEFVTSNDVDLEEENPEK